MKYLGIASILIACLLPAIVHGQCSNTSPCAFVGGAAFTQPQQLESTAGSLSFSLDVDVYDYTLEWLVIHRRLYNGSLSGPTWRVRRGDTVALTINNRLTLPHKTGPANQPKLPNTTNIHTHGLHIGSAEPQDNVFVHISPGESYTYTYTICPEQPAGTYWYHPHLHGSTMLQVHGGLSGMIIVEDPTTGSAVMPDHLAAVSCPNNCAHDVQLLFQPTMQYINNAGRGFANQQQDIEDNPLFRHNQYIITATNQDLETYLTTAANGVDYFTTNGQLWPTLTIPAGQIKRFRMVNAGGSASLELLITNVGGVTAATGCSFMEIAIDGVYLDQARSPRLGKTLIIPSGKADWLVVCDQPGNYEVRSVAATIDNLSFAGFERYNNKLLQITVTGTATSTTIGTTLPGRESFLQDFRSLTENQVEGNFVIEAAAGSTLNREKFSTPTNYRYKMRLGSNQQWFIINTDPGVGHPIHIHVNHFQVISYNPYTGPVSSNARGALTFWSQASQVCTQQHATYTGVNTPLPNNPLRHLGHDVRQAAGGDGTLAYAEIGDFRDAIIIPPLGNITIRFQAHKFTGEIVIHCHILVHEDAGMMMTVEVVDTDSEANLTTNIQSGTAYPGTCTICDPYPFSGEPAANNCTAAVIIVNGNSDLVYLAFLAVIPLAIIIAVIVVCTGSTSTSVGATAGAAAAGVSASATTAKAGVDSTASAALNEAFNLQETLVK
ncbi:multicopper oxidase mco-like [Ciona intestinalis]